MSNSDYKALIEVLRGWRKQLQDEGGWDNELQPIPAGGVRQVIESAERAATAIESLSERAERAEAERTAAVAETIERCAKVCDDMVDWPLENHPAATITKPQHRATIYLAGIRRGLVNATNAIRALKPDAGEKVLVPREPTLPMLQAALDWNRSEKPHNVVISREYHVATQMWKAMLAAAEEGK